MEQSIKTCNKCKKEKDIKSFIKINKTCNDCNIIQKEKRAMNTKSKKKDDDIKKDVNENYILILKDKLLKLVSNEVFNEILKNNVNQ